MSFSAEKLSFGIVEWTVDQASVANTIQTTTKAAVAGRFFALMHAYITYDTAVSTKHDIQLKLGTTVIATLKVPVGTVIYPFEFSLDNHPLVGMTLGGGATQDISVVVGAAGVGVISNVCMFGIQTTAP